MLILSSIITTVYSNTVLNNQKQHLKQTTCVDNLNLSTNIAYPIKISFMLLGESDNIEMSIVDELAGKEVSHFTKHLVASTDTLIYMNEGKYSLVWVSGGFSVKPPYLSGSSVNTSPVGWIYDNNQHKLPFKIFGKIDNCENRVKINAVASYSGTGNLKYKWTPSTGLSTDTIASPIAIVTSNITYSVTATSLNGCTATSDISMSPTALIVNAGDDQSVKGGTSIQLSSTSNYTGTGILKYKWTPATGLNNDAIANPTGTVRNDITYTLTITSPCGQTASDDIKLSLAQLSVDAGADKTVICGGTTQLSCTISNYVGTDALKYKWTPSTGLNNDSISNPTATAINNISYTVTVTALNGSTSSDSVKVIIIPMDKPEIGIVGVSNLNKNRIAWNKVSSKGIAAYNIYKETNVTDIYEKIGSVSYDSLSVFTDNQSAINVKSNKYKMSIVDKSGLESPLSNPHKTMHLSINKGQDNTWNLIWEPYEGFTVSTYNIYRGTNSNNLNFIDATSGSSSQYSDISASGGDVYYQLEVISPTLISPTKVSTSMQKSKESGTTTMVSYNSSRSNIATNFVSGVNELTGDNKQINIYPNPVKDQLRINFEGGSTFEILNLMGQVVYNGDLIKNTIVQISSLSSGVYMIKFKTGETFEYRKIIKE